MATVTYVDSAITMSIALTVNFDDLTKKEKTYTVGDEISIDYIKDRALAEARGTLKRILIPTDGSGTILVIDASTLYSTNVLNVNINNIRGLNDIAA